MSTSAPPEPRKPRGTEGGDLSKLEDVERPLDLSQVARGWHSTNRECCYWVPEADVEGTIPEELRGTLFRNGPGLLEVYGKKLQHGESGFCLTKYLTGILSQ